MDHATARARAAATVRFEDGLGRRHHIIGASPDPVEVLVLRDALAAAPGFEEAVRQQVERLAVFRHPAFAHVRGIARPANSESGIAIISEQIQGVRLSDLLTVAEKRLLPLDMTAALWITRDLLSAVAALHEHVPQVCHGAIAPERIIITPDARLVVVEHVLGTALATLRLSRAQYWRDLRIALPLDDAAPAFNSRNDVAQIGAVALALMLGHPLGQGYPVRIGGITEGASGVTAADAVERLPAGIRAWMCRALQLPAHEPFLSAVDARAEFERVLERSTDGAACKPPEAFMAAYHAYAPMSGQVRDRPHGARLAPAPSRPEPASLAPAPAAAQPAANAAPVPELAVPARASGHSDPIRDEWLDPVRSEVMEPEDNLFARMRPTRRHLAAAAVVVIVIASGSAFALRSRFPATAPAQLTGTLAINTDPIGLAVTIDGQSRGVSPLRIPLPSGNHLLEINSQTARRRIPVTITAGAEVTQFIEMSKQTALASGQLQIRTEPSGARVSVDGHRRGTAPLTIEGLSPGTHAVMVEGDTGTMTNDVTVQAGASSSLVLRLTAPRGALVSGWISVTAPAEVQLFESQRLLGTSRSDRIMATVGKHDLEIVNDALGFRETRTVNVSPGGVTAFAVNWPKGSMALNAVPWAAVWVDGEPVGETPIGNISVPVGPHEILFRHPELGERRYSTIVTVAGPARVSADLRKK
jgi:hypothetical protein